MFPRKTGVTIQCYEDGKKLGEKTPGEWAEELNVPIASIYNGKKTGGLVAGKYKFYAVGVDPVLLDQPKPATLSEMVTEARAQGKSYGQLQAEETLSMIKQQAETKPLPPCITVKAPDPIDWQEMDTEPDLTLGQLAKLITFNCQLSIRRHYCEDNDSEVFTAIADSFIFSLPDVAKLAVESIMPIFEGKYVIVYVKEAP